MGLSAWNVAFLREAKDFQALAAEAGVVLNKKTGQGLGLDELGNSVKELRKFIEEAPLGTTAYQDAVSYEISRTSQMFVNAGVPVPEATC